MKYSVKLSKSGRFIKWCDSHWYETVPYGNPVYTMEQAEAVCAQMRSHYQYRFEIVDERGKTAKDVCFLSEIPQHQDEMFGFILRPAGTAPSTLDIVF